MFDFNRDLAREQKCNFIEQGWGLDSIEHSPENIKNQALIHLRNEYTSELRRNRWQYTIELCNQVISSRVPDEEKEET